MFRVGMAHNHAHGHVRLAYRSILATDSTSVSDKAYCIYNHMQIKFTMKFNLVQSV